MPDLKPAPVAGQDIPADPTPEESSRLKPLLIALPVAALVFVLAFTFIGRKGGAKDATTASFTDAPDAGGGDFRG